MNPQIAVHLLQQTLLVTFWVCLPLLGVLFVVGVLVSLVQTVTSIQDPSFGAVPRLAAFVAAAMILLPWMVNRLTGYTTQLLEGLAQYGR